MSQFPQPQSLTPQVIGNVGGIANPWVAADANLTRPNNATAYAAHQGMGSGASCLFKWSNIFRTKGATGLLSGMRLVGSVASIAVSNLGNIRAHLFNAIPTGLPAADAAALNFLFADITSKVGYIDFSSWQIGGASSDMIESYGTPAVSPLPIGAASTAQDLYAILEATAAFTPLNNTILAPAVSLLGD